MPHTGRFVLQSPKSNLAAEAAKFDFLHFAHLIRGVGVFCVSIPTCFCIFYRVYIFIGSNIGFIGSNIFCLWYFYGSSGSALARIKTIGNF